MALNSDTFYAMPYLPTYLDAKQHYDRVQPIRRDKFNVKPLGRRKQPWVSIWEDPQTKAIHFGYGRGELSERQTLASYHPNGTINVHRRNRWYSASDNERLSRVLGVQVQTYQYDPWIHCSWYDNGERKTGWLPLHTTNNRDWRSKEEVISTFVRDTKGGTLTFVNYTYPTSHKINKAAMREIKAPMAAFLTWLDGMTKLQGTKCLRFSEETKAEFFGWSTSKKWNDDGFYPNSPPALRWGPDLETTRPQVFAWMRSDDTNDWMRAAIALEVARYAAQTETAFIDELLLMTHKGALLEQTTHKHGKLVRDRYRRFLPD